MYQNYYYDVEGIECKPITDVKKQLHNALEIIG